MAETAGSDPVKAGGLSVNDGSAEGSTHGAGYAQQVDVTPGNQPQARAISQASHCAASEGWMVLAVHHDSNTRAGQERKKFFL
jgi:hypothetical protein